MATIVGYAIVAIVAFFVFRFVLGTIYWLIKTLVIIVAILALLTLYLRLKSPPD